MREEREREGSFHLREFLGVVFLEERFQLAFERVRQRCLLHHCHRGYRGNLNNGSSGLFRLGGGLLRRLGTRRRR